MRLRELRRVQRVYQQREEPVNLGETFVADEVRPLQVVAEAKLDFWSFFNVDTLKFFAFCGLLAYVCKRVWRYAYGQKNS